MPKYLSMVKYTTEALNGVRADGYAKRPEAIRSFGDSLGVSVGTVLFLMPSNEWDFVAIMDAESSADVIAMGSFASASGTIEKSCVYELFTGEEIDSAIAGSTPQYSPPGS